MSLDNIILKRAVYNTRMNITEWNSHLVGLYIPLDVFLVLFIVIGVFGNGTVIFVYGFKMKTIKDGQYFIPRLAVVDLLGSIVCPIFGLTTTLMPVTYSADIVCKMGRFLSSSLIFVSVFLLFTIGFQRYNKICRGNGPTTNKKKRILVVFVCLWGLMLSSPNLTSSGSVPFVSTFRGVSGLVCGTLPGMGPIIYDVILAISIPFCCISFIVLYVVIGCRTIYSLKQSQHLDNNLPRDIHRNHVSITKDFKKCDYASSVSSSDQKGTSQTNSRPMKIELTQIQRRNKIVTSQLTLMFMIVTLSFVVCSIPKVTLMFFEILVPNFWEQFSDKERMLLMFVHEGYILNFISNPFIYAFLDKSFRKHLPNIYRLCSKTSQKRK